MSRNQTIADGLSNCSLFRLRHEMYPPEIVTLKLRPSDHPFDCRVYLIGREPFGEK